MDAKTISIPFIKDKKVEDLLMWRNIPKSGTVFGGATVAYILLEWSGLKLLTIFLYLLFAAIITCFVWANTAKVVNKEGPDHYIPSWLKEGVKEEDIKHGSEKLIPFLNKGTAIINRLATGTDTPLSLKVGASLYGAAVLSRYISIFGLVYFVIFLAFTLPKLYELRKDDADKLIEIAKEQLGKVWELLSEQLSKIPIGKGGATPAKKVE